MGSQGKPLLRQHRLLTLVPMSPVHQRLLSNPSLILAPMSRVLLRLLSNLSHTLEPTSPAHLRTPRLLNRILALTSLVLLSLLKTLKTLSSPMLGLTSPARPRPLRTPSSLTPVPTSLARQRLLRVLLSPRTRRLEYAREKDWLGFQHTFPKGIISPSMGRHHYSSNDCVTGGHNNH